MAYAPGAYDPFVTIPQTTIHPKATPGGNITTQNNQYTKKKSPIRKAKTYYPSSVYKATRSAGGGGASATGSALKGGEFEQYGMTPEWMDAYKSFWGQNLPEKLWGVYQPAVNLFTRYTGRLPTVADWSKMWGTMRAEDDTLTNMWRPLEYYEPTIIRNFTRPPLYTPPALTYSPTMSF